MLEDLRANERSVYSQGGEDGVLERIFEEIGTTNRHFVEFGAWDGIRFSNTAWLRFAHGFEGLLLEGDPDRRMPGVHQAMVTAENVESLFARYGVPERFDLLSIDIDGNEYWVWKALRSHRPRVVVIEYNVFFSTDVAKTMPYDPQHAWDESYYHGASLAALRKLGHEKGYALVHTDSYTPNAFFVQRSELPPDWREPAIGEVTFWDWEPGAEPPVGPDRHWRSV